MTQQWWYRSKNSQDVNTDIFWTYANCMIKLDESYGTNKDVLYPRSELRNDWNANVQ